MKAAKLAVEVVNVGNELLDGRTLNTNLQWLCERLSRLGYMVERATIVRDDVAAISVCIREVLKRRPGWLLISGGLGPTHDDKTLEGVARALGVGLRLNRKAVEMLRLRYEEMKRTGLIASVELTKERLKMAKLPVGSKPLANRVGTAPGVLVELRSTRIVCLPGVPRELQDIFENHIAPLMLSESGGRSYVTESLTLKGVFESSLAPILVETMKRYPGLYLKSNPKGIEDGISLVTVDFIAEKKDAEKIREAMSFLQDRIRGFHST
jgi:molybdenum cofactor synthesis domain-containing protein